uniref:GIL1/IRKI C-terminal domain-containing protein n=1 Tax=Cucumis melo TaxID=3656 RepID=A0A9I9D8J6_CUCME
MAATSATKMFHNAGDVSRQEIQAAIAKAVELRALHAALMQGSSPSNLRFPSASPISQFSAQDYPVFTPSYEDEPTNGYHQVPMRIGTFSESWDEYGLGGGGGGGNEDETVLSDYKKEISKDFTNLEPHICPAEDHKHLTGHAFQSSPVNDYFKSSRRNSLGDSKSVSSCNRCRPAIITKETDNTAKNSRLSNTIVPLTDSHLSTQSQPKSRGVISRLFPRLKKKNKYENSPNRTESEDVSQIFKDLGIVSIETLKKELINANETRDAALMEVSEMKTSLGELRQKLEGLENYCEELKRALKQATNARDLQTATNLHKRTTSTAGMNEENRMPVSEEVMVEGFLQIVSEARLSVKQFCKTLVSQIEETDNSLMENLNSILQPYKLSLNSKYSRAVLYHLEAIINQALYQDFENCVFQKNGSPKLLDPHQDRQAQFSSFVALRNLSWNEVLRKGTKYYSEEFSKFCDQKMSCIITTLNWTRPWPEQLLQAFFVAGKCIWLLHLLAFSFDPPLKILRVEENRSFDSSYMDDVFAERQKNGPSRVKIMVMPGFYVQEKILRCKVVCRYKSLA